MHHFLSNDSFISKLDLLTEELNFHFVKLCGRLKTKQASVKIVQKNSKNSIYIDLNKKPGFFSTISGIFEKNLKPGSLRDFFKDLTGKTPKSSWQHCSQSKNSN
jgi:hypothetical protein